MKTTRPDSRPTPPRTDAAREAPKPQVRNEIKPQPQTARRPEEGFSNFDSKARRAPNAETLGAAAIALQPSRVAPGSYPTAADVKSIAAMENPVERNLAITQGYHDLSNALGEMLGKENANWATFGTWASKQAGASIRQEDLPKFLMDAIKGSGAVGEKLSKMDDVLRKLGLPALPLGDIAAGASEALNNVSKAIADGNQFVFREIGQEMARFVDTFKDDTQLDPAKLEKFLGEIPAEKPLLKEAFTAYAKAQFEQDPNKKAELMLLGNNKIGLHEQTQLTPFIEKALNTPVKDTFRKILDQTIDAGIKALPFGLEQGAKLLKKTGIVDAAVNPLVDALAGVFRRLSTEHMMKLAVPGGALKIGNDLPPPAAFEKDIFPPHLRSIENPELREVLGKLDRSPDSLQGTGAKDWSKLDQRMNYIIDLFRSRQSDPHLFDPPFGRAGRYPVAQPRVS
ncbi:hypothetical protein [Hyalangium sp.]|uniref:hypothetical protein n=1 Tax=Hyalangium sp. TaxID=2028555 RepID=UPI002D6727B1|nr:hypothetical protein [Hyalangium sp.]HYH96292.1 hypothetical protein [Hyalangium sp.]